MTVHAGLCRAVPRPAGERSCNARKPPRFQAFAVGTARALENAMGNLTMLKWLAVGLLCLGACQPEGRTTTARGDTTALHDGSVAPVEAIDASIDPVDPLARNDVGEMGEPA